MIDVSDISYITKFVSNNNDALDISIVAVHVCRQFFIDLMYAD